MSSLHLLSKLGVYTHEHFLSLEECAEIRGAIDASTKTQAGVASHSHPHSHQNKQLRQTLYAQIPAPLHGIIRNRVLALKSDLESHFQEVYAEQFEPPKYLQYPPGHFFAPHTDNQMYRRLNISIYLNNQSTGAHPDNSEYTGGELRLFGLFPSKAWQHRGIVVPGIAGLLIAYPADIVHEITPIVSGSRYAIVSRFLSASADSCSAGS